MRKPCGFDIFKVLNPDHENAYVYVYVKIYVGNHLEQGNMKSYFRIIILK